MRLNLSMLVLLSVLFLSGRAEANPAVQSSLKKTYPQAKAVSCKTCHQNAIGRGGDLNAYGTALQKAKLDFKAIEAEDSDGDGAPNLKELESGTNPGETAPKP